MPGKHAPASPRSFYLSLARAGAVLVTVVAVIVAIVMVATGDSKKPAASASRTPSPSVSPTPSSSPLLGPIQVVVLNGTDRKGLAKNVATTLTADGWIVKSFGNAPTAAHTTIYVRNGATSEGQRLRRTQFRFMSEDAVVEASANDPGSKEKAALTVVIGADYKAPGKPTASPSS